MAEIHEQKIDEPYEQRIKTAFCFWGALIAERAPGSYVVLDHNNPDLSDEQRAYMDLDTAYYPTTQDFLLPGDHEFGKLLVRELGNKLLPEDNFEEIVTMFEQEEELMRQLRAMAEHPTEEHENIIILSNHPWLMNIGVLEGALFCAVDRPGFGQNLGITVSKTLGFMEGVVEHDEETGEPISISALQILRAVGDVFTTIPPTDSTDRPELVELKDFATNYKSQGFNFLMIRPYLEKAKARNGFVSVIAGSGSLDKPSEENPDILIMKPVSENAAKLLSKTAAKVVVVPTFLSPNGIMSAEVAAIKDVTTPDDIHDAMQIIASYYRTYSGGVGAKYDDPRYGKLVAT